MAAESEPWDVPPQPRRWTANEYLRASEAGIFAADEKLELLDGEIYRRMSHGEFDLFRLSAGSRSG